jgi:hypothetical protein
LRFIKIVKERTPNHAEAYKKFKNGLKNRFIYKMLDLYTIKNSFEIDFFEDYFIFNDGRVYSKKSKKFLKEAIDSNGYKFVNLCNENGMCAIRISRLVADYFVENTENKNEVDHIDRNKSNNNYTNLRWVSSQENNLNKKKRKDNKSGFIGIYLNNKKHYWRATYNKDGKQINKYFSFLNNNDKKTKFKEACEWRNKMTDENYDPKYFIKR